MLNVSQESCDHYINENVTKALIFAIIDIM